MNDIIKLTYREGEEIKTMEFPSLELSYERDIPSFGMVQIGFTKFGINTWSIDKQKIININPLYLEFITLEDCPECEGTGRGMLTIHNRDGTGTKVPMIHDLPDTDMNCKKCTEGIVEVVTLKVLFKPDEYDEALTKQLREIIKEYADSDTEWRKRNMKAQEIYSKINLFPIEKTEKSTNEILKIIEMTVDLICQEKVERELKENNASK